MRPERHSGARSPLGALLILGIMASCVLYNALPERAGPPRYSTLFPDTFPPDTGVFRSKVPEEPGVAVSVLIDYSATLRDTVPGTRKSKHTLAREAARHVVEAAAAYGREHPEWPVKIGMNDFAEFVSLARPMDPYDSASVEVALTRPMSVGGPGSIGDAMNIGRWDLYQSGLTRKHLVVVTDGVNGRGYAPDSIAREIRARSRGAVRIHFVAFDRDPAKFGFVEEIGGEVFPATGGARLREAMLEVLRKEILPTAEAGGYGDGFALPRDTARGAL